MKGNPEKMDQNNENEAINLMRKLTTGIDAVRQASNQDPRNHAAPEKKRAANKKCHKMLLSHIGKMRHGSLSGQDALVCIKALRDVHQPECPNKCHHTDERLSIMVEEFYALEEAFWPLDWNRITYIAEHAENKEESLVLAVLMLLADADGSNKSCMSQDNLAATFHMNKPKLAQTMRNLHNRGLVTIHWGKKHHPTKYQLHKTPIRRLPDEMLGEEVVPNNH